MPIPHRLLVATRNPGKLTELRDLLAPLGIEILSPEAVSWSEEVSEDGDTLEENALQKAREGSRITGMATLADDSGLFVDALEGAPGVRSARYAGEEQDAGANCDKLLGALEGVPEERRGAEFRCVLALVLPGGEQTLFSGVCRGRIHSRRCGSEGFGYDPIFIPAGERVTFAEMLASRKHDLSHRGRALLQLRRHIRESKRAKDTSE